LQTPPGNYSGTLFANAIQQLTDDRVPDTLKVTYNGITSNITISTTSTAPTNLSFQILTDADCIARLNGLYVYPIDSKNPRAANDILRNYGNSPVYNKTSPYTSGFLNFSPTNDIYLSSPNLGTFTTLSPTGSMNVIKKIPVSADWGYMIIDRVVSQHDYLECGAQNLRTLEFNLRDAKGNEINLNGENISFSIVFSTQLEDR
jgi:hypothetical protein